MNTVTTDTWDKNQLEPVWHYSLDQVIRELLRQNGNVPLLAVDHLGRGHRAVLWSPELAVTMHRDTVELDIAVIVDGRIIVGEAKSNGKLGDGKKNLINSAKRLVAAAKTLAADEIVIATSMGSWSPGTREAVEASISTTWASGPQPYVTEITSVGASGGSSGDNAQQGRASD